MIKWIKNLGDIPVIFGADFNTGHDTPVMTDTFLPETKGSLNSAYSLTNNIRHTTFKYRKGGDQPEKCKPVSHMIDYIFYSKKHWNCVRTLDIPDLKIPNEKSGLNLNNPGLPNWRYPSDHIMIGAELCRRRTRFMPIRNYVRKFRIVRENVNKEKTRRTALNKLARTMHDAEGVLKKDKEHKVLTKAVKTSEKNMKIFDDLQKEMQKTWKSLNQLGDSSDVVPMVNEVGTCGNLDEGHKLHTEEECKRDHTEWESWLSPHKRGLEEAVAQLEVYQNLSPVWTDVQNATWAFTQAGGKTKNEL